MNEGGQGPRWAAPDAATLARAREMSPMSYIRHGLPPTFIVNGGHDPAVDPTQDAQLKKALDAAAVPDGQDIVPGGGHGNFPKAETDKAMLLCLKFLKARGILRERSIKSRQDHSGRSKGRWTPSRRHKGIPATISLRRH